MDRIKEYEEKRIRTVEHDPAFLRWYFAPSFSFTMAQLYLQKNRKSIAGWMERKKVVWIPTMLAIGLAIAIVWGVR